MLNKPYEYLRKTYTPYFINTKFNILAREEYANLNGYLQITGMISLLSLVVFFNF